MHQIHDKGYKRLFKNKGIFRQLLETFVAKDWVKELDFKTCETLDKSFVSAQYKETVSDIIHKIKLRRQNIFIVILTEFKSSVERFTSLDIAHYVASFYKDFVESNKKVRMLPPVFPILLYNGNAKWTAPTKLSDLIEGSGYLGEYSLDFAYHKIAITEYPQKYLLRIKNVVSLLFLAEAYYDAKLLEREFLEVFEREKDKRSISLLLNWFIQLRKHGRFPEKDVEKLQRIYASKEEVRKMLITALEKEKRELAAKLAPKIAAKVTAKVTAKVKLEQQTEIARKMLIEGFDLPRIAKLTGLSEKVILQLKQEMEN
jgi:predicted transposase/invertase (TIGR01784 family)